SRAPHRIAYRVCSACEQPYRPLIRHRIAKALGCAVLALLCVIGGQAVAASMAWAIALVCVAISLVVLCIYYSLSGAVTPVAIVPDDGGRVCERLREWIVARRGSRLRRAFRFVSSSFWTVTAGIGYLICFGVGAKFYARSQEWPPP